MAAVTDPLPLIIPVIVPRHALPPKRLTVGSSAKSAETAEVMMLLGPPINIPISANNVNRSQTGNCEGKRNNNNVTCMSISLHNITLVQII